MKPLAAIMFVLALFVFSASDALAKKKGGKRPPPHKVQVGLVAE